MAGGMGGYGGPNLPPMQPMQPMPPPMREKRSGSNGCLIGGLIGCGVLLLLFVVAGVVGMNALKNGKNGFTKMVTDVESSMKYARNLVPISAALEKYKDDHEGKYPPSLDALVPKYLRDKSYFKPNESGLTVAYTPPKPNAKPDTAVVSISSGASELAVFGQTTQTTQIFILLKDGKIVKDQVTRSDFSRQLGK